MQYAREYAREQGHYSKKMEQTVMKIMTKHQVFINSQMPRIFLERVSIYPGGEVKV